MLPPTMNDDIDIAIRHTGKYETTIVAIVIFGLSLLSRSLAGSIVLVMLMSMSSCCSMLLSRRFEF